MNKEIVIRSINSAVDFAVLHDGRLIELQKEKDNNKFNVGDIFIAKIKKTITGLNAAFVNVGYEKDAFLHYHDLGPKVKTLLKFTKLVSEGKITNYSLEKFNFEKEIDKKGKIDDVLSPNLTILAQIIKEPISTKGPRISSELSFAGRFLVLIPFSNRISISQKIKSKKERDRLKKLIEENRPKGFGVIIRTVAQGKKIAELEKDLQGLYNQWLKLCGKINGAKIPSRILSELNRSSSILRDLFDDQFKGIYCNNKELCYELKDYIQQIAPKKKSVIKYYKSDKPIFEHFNIERQIKSAFGRTVSMSKGAYLIIEHTEALHVKPDNTLGKKAIKSNGSTGQTGDDDPRSVQIKIISCQWLPKAEGSNDIPDPFVKVEIFLANGQVCSDQTKSSQGNGFSPHWEDEDFEFVVDNPYLSIVRFSVWDSNVFTSPKMIGQRSVPFCAISPGYRHIELWSSDGNPLGKGSIFVQVIKERTKGRRFLCF